MHRSTLLSGHLMPADIVDLNDYQVESWPSTPRRGRTAAPGMAGNVRDPFLAS